MNPFNICSKRGHNIFRWWPFASEIPFEWKCSSSVHLATKTAYQKDPQLSTNPMKSTIKYSNLGETDAKTQNLFFYHAFHVKSHSKNVQLSNDRNFSKHDWRHDLWIFCFKLASAPASLFHYYIIVVHTVTHKNTHSAFTQKKKKKWVE